MKDTTTPKDLSRAKDSKSHVEKKPLKGGREMQGSKTGSSDAATKSKPKIEKTTPQKANVELQRAKFSTETKRALPVDNSKGEAKRHIISSQDMKTVIEDKLDGETLDKAAKALREKDKNLVDAHPKSNKEIQQGAKELYKRAFNDQKNLWVGSQVENAKIGTAVDKPKEWSGQKLGAHKREMKRKYFWGDTHF